MKEWKKVWDDWKWKEKQVRKQNLIINASLCNTPSLHLHPQTRVLTQQNLVLAYITVWCGSFRDPSPSMQCLHHPQSLLHSTRRESQDHKWKFLISQDWKWHPSLLSVFCCQDLSHRHCPRVTNGGWKMYFSSVPRKKRGLWLLLSANSLVWMAFKQGNEGIEQFRWESNHDDTSQREETAFSAMAYKLIFSIEACSACKWYHLQIHKLS